MSADPDFRLTQLEELKVGNNPFIESVPKDSLKSRETLFQWLADSEKGSQSFSIVKLMFVGDGNVRSVTFMKIFLRTTIIILTIHPSIG